MIKTIFFDFDGVIVNSEPTYFEYKVKKLQEMGFPVTREYLLTRIGESVRIILPKLFNVENPEKYIEDYYNDPRKKYIDYRPLMYPELIEVLDYCKENGIKCYITSNSKVEHLKNTCEQLDILHYFDGLYSIETFGVAKPDPLFYTRIVEDLNLNKEEILVIEDSEHGISAAKNAGLYTIAKKEDYFNIDQSYADTIIDLLTEVLDIIKEKNA